MDGLGEGLGLTDGVDGLPGDGLGEGLGAGEEGLGGPCNKVRALNSPVLVPTSPAPIRSKNPVFLKTEKGVIMNGMFSVNPIYCILTNKVYVILGGFAPQYKTSL